MPNSNLTIKNINNLKINISESKKTLLSHIHTAQTDWMHACGGKGRCVTCRVRILEGAQLLSEPSEFEAMCHHKGLLKPDERLACQCSPVEAGEIYGEVPDKCKLKHIEYSY
ncbi:hypothetical protein FUAX_25370 [Fulvitalea axinellae]|uniref:2Fe-2S ferredoxin-type domain-containing protein n=1 Tax=Fulvitalea axinellae TaxID=1182444 RepID=A0AAU9DGF6_9BACT|nr:hypothetical protein FUAX_25370 [Fulvitalea axinellae]